MKATVKKWGNSAAIRIPSHLMQAIPLETEEEGTIREDKGSTVIEPTRSKKYDLKDLLKGITTKNRHNAVDFGKSEGNEVW